MILMMRGGFWVSIREDFNSSTRCETHCYQVLIQQRTRYCLNVYDLNEDKYISKEEMLTLIKNWMVKSGNKEEDGEEKVKVVLAFPTLIDKVYSQELIEITLHKLDSDKDGRISFSISHWLYKSTFW